MNLPVLSGVETGRKLKISILDNLAGGTLNFSPNVLLEDSVSTLALSYVGTNGGAVLVWLGDIWRVGLAGARNTILV